MVWLDVAANDGSALYFVTDRVERLQGGKTVGFSVSGILGDGQYEGEVIVEVGTSSEVTYVDSWLAAGDFGVFQRRIDLDQVTAALTEVAEQTAAGLGRRILGSGLQRAGRNGKIAENSPVWRAVA